MRVRKLDESRDMTFGKGQLNFHRDSPLGVVQCVETRLQEYVGDWYLDLAAGTPWRTRVLGKYTEDLRDPAVRSRVLGTSGVKSIVTYSSQTDRTLRGLAIQVEVDTLYGPGLVVAGPPVDNGDVRYVR